jgi:hypothetical protein
VPNTRTRSVVAVVAGFLAIPALIAAPANATIVGREDWHAAGTNSIGCDGFTLDNEYDFEGHVLVKSGRRGDPMLYFMERVSGHNKLTNPATGHWFTFDVHQLNADTRITKVSGNIYTIEWMTAGSPFTVRDMDGKIVTADVGRVVFSIQIDNNGTPEIPDDDIADDSTFTIVAVNGPHDNILFTACDVAVKYNLL